MQSCAAEPERSAASQQCCDYTQHCEKCLSQLRCELSMLLCKKRIDVDRQNPSRFTTDFDIVFAAKLSQGRILGDFWRDRRQFSGQAWRHTHFAAHTRGKKTLRTELLVNPGRSRSCQSVATKPGVLARAVFPLRKALPLRNNSGEHFRFRLITRD